MNIIEKIKLVTDGNLDDDVIQIYIDRAVSSIYAYLNNPRITEEVILDKYEAAVIMMVENAYDTRDKRHVREYRQGQRRVSYFESANEFIPEEVRRILPAPYVRMW